MKNEKKKSKNFRKDGARGNSTMDRRLLLHTSRS